MHFFDILNTAFKIKKRGLTPASRPGRGMCSKFAAPFFWAPRPNVFKIPRPPPAPKRPPRGGHAPIAPGAYFPALAALAALALARRARSADLCSSLSGRRAGFGWTFTNPFGTMKCPTWGCPPQIS